MTEHFYLDRAERQHLDKILAEIPGLTADLAAAVAMQTRLAREGRRGGSEHGLPFDVDAATAADELRNELSTTVRMVCEQRALDYLPPGFTHHKRFVGPLCADQRRVPNHYDEGSMSTLAKWLRAHMMSVAATEGAPDAHEAIDRAFKRAARCVCPPYRPVVLDLTRVAEARERIMHASAIESLARELGEEYRHLNVRRIQRLRDVGQIKPIHGPWPAKVHAYWSGEVPAMYAVGSVLDAHLRHPNRARRAKSLSTV